MNNNENNENNEWNENENVKMNVIMKIWIIMMKENNNENEKK